jgi:hypothetical protein
LITLAPWSAAQRMPAAIVAAAGGRCAVQTTTGRMRAREQTPAAARLRVRREAIRPATIVP